MFLFLQFNKAHSCCFEWSGTLPLKRLSIKFISPLLQLKVLTAIQCILPSCSTCTKGKFLLILKFKVCPRTGSCKPFAWENCFFSIFCTTLIILLLNILLSVSSFKSEYLREHRGASSFDSVSATKLSLLTVLFSVNTVNSVLLS